jgi:hypothetical protein
MREEGFQPSPKALDNAGNLQTDPRKTLIFGRFGHSN